MAKILRDIGYRARIELRENGDTKFYQILGHFPNRSTIFPPHKIIRFQIPEFNQTPKKKKKSWLKFKFKSPKNKTNYFNHPVVQLDFHSIKLPLMFMPSFHHNDDWLKVTTKLYIIAWILNNFVKFLFNYGKLHKSYFWFAYKLRKTIMAFLFRLS